MSPLPTLLANYPTPDSKTTFTYPSSPGSESVPPRYHPIKGVPSDFLRNRLMLSMHEDIRNAVGIAKFVELRIKYQDLFELFFRSRRRDLDTPEAFKEKRKHWDLKLPRRAKDDLFNMFHNKSDDFLDSVAQGRIKIIGGNADESYKTYYDFGQTRTIALDPEFIDRQKIRSPLLIIFFLAFVRGIDAVCRLYLYLVSNR